MKIAVLTHNPQGKWGDVRPQIEEGFYNNWGKGGLNLEVGQQVLIYISKSLNKIQYIMEVSNVHDDSVDLKLIEKLDEAKSNLLSFEELKKNGLKVGTVNYILDNNESLFKYVNSVLNNIITKERSMSIMQIKNIILYGAPGVGKTHNYKNLICMIEEGKSQKEIFDTISKNLYVSLENETFEKIKEEKRVEFVTFHQSYSYEDFIEGFRPSENGGIELDKKGGIFKRIADEARKNLDNSQKEISAIVEQKKFEEIFELFKDLIQDEIDRNKKFNINETVYISNIEEDAFRYTGNNWGNTQRMKFVDIELLYSSGIVERKEIKKLDNISGLAKQHATYFSYFMKKLINFRKSKNIEVKDVESVKEKNFYIVIDEINRGNISKIFGELITLIEEDKRDKYEVTLPYSKTKFKVPSNLYIIATMNSTDKSIATIDIALRRRFTFLKMQPNLELVKNEQAKVFMQKANEYISEKLGEDYMLGHSYFMGDVDLDFIKEYKIKPLLEEYFYADEKSSDEIMNEIEDKRENI